MNYVLIFIFSVFMFCAQNAVFANTVIRAGVDKTQVNAGELVTYKLTVVSSEKNIPTVIPEFIGFSVISQEERVLFQQREMQTTRVFTFILLPLETGRLRIEPAQVTALGKVYSSRSFRINVKQDSATIQPRRKSRIPLPEQPAPQEEPGPAIPDSGQPQYNL